MITKSRLNRIFLLFLLDLLRQDIPKVISIVKPAS